MKAPPLVLDTNALSAHGFPHWLEAYAGEKVLPAIVFTEAAVLHASRGKLERFRGLLRRIGVEIEWFRVEEGERAARAAARVGDFAENARDHLIAAHVHGERVLVTRNLRDFSHLRSVVTPDEAMNRFGKR